MKKKIDSEIRRLILEITLIVVFTVVTLPLWDYVDNKTLAEVANHYSEIDEGNIIVTNKIKGIYSSTYEEAIREFRTIMITSYEEEITKYSLYIVLDLMYDYKNIMFSNGTEIYRLSDLLEKSTDMNYFKLTEDIIESKETKTFYYYIWTDDLKSSNNIKLKFIVK